MNDPNEGIETFFIIIMTAFFFYNRNEWPEWGDWDTFFLYVKFYVLVKIEMNDPNEGIETVSTTHFFCSAFSRIEMNDPNEGIETLIYFLFST